MGAQFPVGVHILETSARFVLLNGTSYFKCLLIIIKHWYLYRRQRSLLGLERTQGGSCDGEKNAFKQQHTCLWRTRLGGLVLVESEGVMQVRSRDGKVSRII